MNVTTRHVRCVLIVMRLAMLLLLVDVVSVHSREQQAVQPARRGNAIVRGIVVAADSGAPLHRAYVRMKTERSQEVATVTNVNGAFEITGLPAGTYAVSAAKGGWARLGYRAVPPLTGTILEIADGQVIDGLRMALVRGGVVAGTFTDESGNPVAGARVSALIRRVRDSGAYLDDSWAWPERNSSDITDDQGRFRIIGLPANTYYIGAFSEAQFGSYVGNRNPLRDLDFTPTYYPGTYDAGQAVAIQITPGIERTANFALSGSRLARVAGRVQNENSVPVRNAHIVLSDQTSGVLSARPVIRIDAVSRDDGTFELANVPPGEFSLLASVDDKVETNRRHATLRIRVDRNDLRDVTLSLGSGSVAAGKVVTDDGTPFLALPEGLVVFLQMSNPLGPPWTPPRATLNPDGTFAIGGVFESRYVRAQVGFSRSYCLERVLHNGQDITDTPVDFTAARRLEGIEIRITAKCSQITGLVSDERGRPIAATPVFAYSRVAEHWVYASRHVRTTQTDGQGRYQFVGLPGDAEYFVIAGPEMGTSYYIDDPAFRRDVRASATLVRLGKNATTLQDLNVVRLPP